MSKPVAIKKTENNQMLTFRNEIKIFNPSYSYETTMNILSRTTHWSTCRFSPTCSSTLTTHSYSISTFSTLHKWREDSNLLHWNCSNASKKNAFYWNLSCSTVHPFLKFIKVAYLEPERIVFDMVYLIPRRTVHKVNQA